MTTFTLQDLNTIPVTKEEDEAMQALTEKQQEQLAQHEQAHKIVQGASGFQYTPMDTSPEAQSVSTLVQQLTQTFNQLLQAIAQQAKQPQQPSEGLQEAVDTVLQNAHWFKEMIAEKIDSVVEDRDFDYEIESAVESHFSNSFSLDDHVDISSEVESAVENQIADVVEERLADIVRDKLQNLRITFD